MLGEESDFLEGAAVNQQSQPLAGGQFSCLMLLGDSRFAATGFEVLALPFELADAGRIRH